MALNASRLACSAVIAAAGAVAHADVPYWTSIELQARSNLIVNDEGWNVPPGTSFNSISPALNDAQQVAFTAGVVPIDGDLAHTGAGLWIGGHASGEFVVVHDPGTDPKAFVGISDPSLGADGGVAYYTFGDPSYRLWHYDPLAGDSALVSVLPLTPSAFSNPVLTADGRIGFRASLVGGSAIAITAAGGGASAHAYDAGVDPGSPYAYLYSPDTSLDGRIFVKTSVGDTSHNEIRVFDGLYQGTRIAADAASDSESPFAAFDNGLAVSRDGRHVAFVTRLVDGNVRALYRVTIDGEGAWQPVEIARVDASGTIREIQFFAPVVNDDGVVAFRASDVNGQAIYVGDGKQLVRLAGNGDVVATDLGSAQLGQHDSSPVFSGKPAINANGDIAFVAGLHPEGNNQIEWGSGVFVAYAETVIDDRIFADGFEGTDPGS